MATRTPQQRRGRIVLTILAIFLAASVWRTMSVETEKHRIAKAYAEAQRMVDQLTAERQRLTDAVAEGSRQPMDEGRDTEVLSLERKLQAVQVQLDSTVVELDALQRKYEAVQLDNLSKTEQLATIMEENRELQSRLSSLKGLRLAIRDVKRKMRRERVEQQKEIDRAQLAAGNHGYVVKEGQSTLGGSPRLHVHVLELQSP